MSSGYQHIDACRFTAASIAPLMHADCLNANTTLITDVQIDSRACTKGSLFFALKGEKNDGFSFLSDVCDQGAAAVVVPKSRAKEARARVSCPVLAVDDVLTALHDLAQSYLQRLSSVKTIGITGSCGKSTTKEALSRITAVMGPTAKTPGNLNSEYGLPLSMFGLQEDSRYGVFEMGIDHVGEMDRMVGTLKPSIALLTNIGISHLEKMGSQEVIAEQKARIFHPGLEAGFVSSNCSHLDLIERVAGRNLVRYDSNEISAIDLGLDGWMLTCEGHTFSVKSVGRHLLEDVVGAIRVARYLGAHASDIAEALQGFEPMQGRSFVHRSEVTIIDDSYNASLDSANSILTYLSGLSWQGSKKVVLGPMKELGALSKQAHRMVARTVASSSFDQTYLYGAEMEEASQELRELGYRGEVSYTRDFEELESMVQKHRRRGDLFLLKASRSVAMERLIPSLQRSSLGYAI